MKFKYKSIILVISDLTLLLEGLCCFDIFTSQMSKLVFYYYTQNKQNHQTNFYLNWLTAYFFVTYFRLWPLNVLAILGPTALLVS